MNIYDIAKETGYSIATVSRAINNPEKVSKKAKDKILKFCKDNDYSPNPVAQTLSKKESKNIALVIPDIKNEFFTSIHRGLSNVIKRHDYNVVLYDTNDSVSLEKNILLSLKRQIIAGLVLVPTDENNKEIIEILINLRDHGIPVVLVDREIKNASFAGVYVDNVQGSFDAVEALINKGNKRIATITGPLNTYPGEGRYKGYLKAMREYNIEVDKSIVLEGDFKSEKAKKLFLSIFEKGRNIDAIFCANNKTTIGVVAAAKTLDLIPGKDIDVAGFDFVNILNILGIDLIMVDRPEEEMGEEAGKIIIDELKEKNQEKKIILKTHLRV